MQASRTCVAEPLEARALFSAGDLDTSFGGGDGRVLSPAGFELTFDSAPMADGGWVAVGGVRRGAGEGIDYGVRRYRADGLPETAFGNGGVATIDFGAANAFPSAVAVGPDGRIVVAGNGTVARLNPDGSPDRTFGGDGVVVNDGTQPSAEVADVLVQNDGRIVVAGGTSDFFLARYNADGSPDATFGDGGFQVTDLFGTFLNELNAVAVDGAGRIVAAGTAGRSAGPGNVESDVAVLRYTASGQLDASFGPAGGSNVPGIVLTNLREGNDFAIRSNDFGTAIEVLGDGRLAVGAGFDNAARPPRAGGAVLLYSADGRSVRELGGDAATMARVNDLTVSPDGRLLAAGPRQGDLGSDFALAAYLPSGAPDPLFADADVADFSLVDVPVSAVVRSDGRVDVAGYSRTVPAPVGNDFALARYAGVPLTPVPDTQTLQAEDARRISGAAVRRTNRGYTGSGYVDYQNAAGDFIEWDVAAATGGTRTLTFRYANGSSARPLEMRVNGAVVRTGLVFPSTGSWFNWQTLAVNVPLEPGVNPVRLTGSSGPNIDALTVGPATPTDPQTYQAEAAVVTGATVSRSNRGYTGTGYVDFGAAFGEAVEWSATVPESRQYILEFRYANGSAASTRDLRLRVDGAIVTPATVAFPSTGSWSAWRGASATVPLAAGRHTIRLESIGFSGPNLDALTVRPAD